MRERSSGHVPEAFQELGLPEGEEEKGVHELAAADIVEIRLVGSLSLAAGAEGVEREVLKVLGIVVVTRDKGIEAPGESINRGVEGRVVLVGEDNVEVSVQLGSGEVSEMLGDEGNADEVALRALASSKLKGSRHM